MNHTSDTRNILSDFEAENSDIDVSITDNDMAATIDALVNDVVHGVGDTRPPYPLSTHDAVVEPDSYDKQEADDGYATYPISNTMFYDINYHAQKHPIVNLHVCPYQRQTDMRGRTFVQYFMKLNMGENGEKHSLSFFNNPFFVKNLGEGGDDSTVMECANIMTKIIMASYGTFLEDTSKFEYKGFHADGADFYAFFDMTEVLIVYHMLSMDDPFWTVTVREIVDTGEVCGYPVLPHVTRLFRKHPELVHVVSSQTMQRYTLPRVGYALAEKKNLDRELMFGKNSELVPNLGDEPYFVFKQTYADCLHEDMRPREKIVMRYALMGDDFIHICDENGAVCFATHDFYVQTSLIAHTVTLPAVACDTAGACACDAACACACDAAGAADTKAVCAA